MGAASIRGTSGASARASVTQQGAALAVFDAGAPFALRAWSGQIGAASAFDEVLPAITVHDIGVPRSAPTRQ